MSHNELVLDWLKRKGEIDPMTALSKLGVYRLGARIYDLRRRGYNIVTIPKVYINAKGQTKRYALYRLASDFELG